MNEIRGVTIPGPLLAIDPGPVTSGVVLIEANQILDAIPAVDNEEFILSLHHGYWPVGHVVIEMIESFGMAVGASTFETCVWIGRFTQALGPALVHRVTRREVKLALCNSSRAKDANVRQAVIDRFPATGGGKVPQIGTKAQPGPLFGVKSHAWSALSVALTWGMRQA